MIYGWIWNRCLFIFIIIWCYIWKENNSIFILWQCFYIMAMLDKITKIFYFTKNILFKGSMLANCYLLRFGERRDFPLHNQMLMVCLDLEVRFLRFWILIEYYLVNKLWHMNWEISLLKKFWNKQDFFNWAIYRIILYY